jgi:SAM-dependent methyltransferase
MDAPERERALADIEHASGASFSDFEGERSVYAPLSLDDIEEMRKGGVRFGAHTRTHPILSRTTSEHALEEEMNGARDALERNIGSISRFFAYPNGQSGDWDRRAERLLENAGCPGAVTTLEGVNTRETHPLRLRRMVLDATDEGWVFAAIASGVRLWLRKIKDMRPVRNHTRARAPEGPTGRAISNGMRTEVSYFNDTSSSYLAEYGRETPEGYSFRVRRDKVLALLPNGASKKILDLASGPGVMIKGLRAKGYTVTCVDAAPDMIELAKKEAGDDPNVTCEVGDAYHLRFDDALFDAVTVMGLIEYLEDETAYLKETARVLKPGGTLIITVPNVWSPWRVWNRMLRGIRAFVRPSKAGLLHREYTRRGFGALLENTGFSVRAVRYYNFKLVPYPLDRFLPRLTVWQSALFEKLDRTPLRFLGTGFIVEAAKN